MNVQFILNIQSLLYVQHVLNIEPALQVQYLIYVQYILNIQSLLYVQYLVYVQSILNIQSLLYLKGSYGECIDIVDQLNVHSTCTVCSILDGCSSSAQRNCVCFVNDGPITQRERVERPFLSAA